MSKPPMKRTSSGNHPAVIRMHEQFAEVEEKTIPKIDEAIEKIDRVLSKPPPPLDAILTDATETPILPTSGIPIIVDGEIDPLYEEPLTPRMVVPSKPPKDDA